MSKTLPLSKGLVTTVDDEDFDELNKYKWSAKQDRNTGRIYVARRDRQEDGTYVPVILHRVICNTPEGMETDHIDRDTLNNQRSNLRIATPQQNRCNRGLFQTNKYGFRGVRARHGRWGAHITAHGKRIWIGTFDSLHDAARAYDVVALEAFGEFASLNFPCSQSEQSS